MIPDFFIATKSELYDTAVEEVVGIIDDFGLDDFFISKDLKANS